MALGVAEELSELVLEKAQHGCRLRHCSSNLLRSGPHGSCLPDPLSGPLSDLDRTPPPHPESLEQPNHRQPARTPAEWPLGIGAEELAGRDRGRLEESGGSLRQPPEDVVAPHHDDDQVQMTVA